jgi:hypothetical protein
VIIQLKEYQEFKGHKTQDPTDSYDLKIKRIIGFMDAVNFIKFFNFFAHNKGAKALDSNPRKPKESSVTKDITKTLEEDPEAFMLRSKGILFSVSDCEPLERSRFRLEIGSLSDRDGILDGGHNTYAIAKFILDKISIPAIAKVRNFESLLKEWLDHSADIEEFLKTDALRLKFLVPVDIIYPDFDETHQNFERLKTEWTDAHHEITNARNNNVQLTNTTKADHKGYYSSLKNILKGRKLESNVIWKTNDTDGGKRTIAAQDVLAIALIPLSVVYPKVVGDSLVIIYSGKSQCAKRYETVIETLKEEGKTEEREGEISITDQKALSALELVPEFIRAYDYLQLNFPEVYNKVGGSFGRISSVEHYGLTDNSTLKKPPKTKFLNKEGTYKYSDAYIYPILSALRSLVEDKGDVWGLVRPLEDYLKEQLPTLIRTTKSFLTAHSFVPDRVGKDAGLYSTLSDNVRKDVEILNLKENQKTLI